jgi:hypothetical protein
MADLRTCTAVVHKGDIGKVIQVPHATGQHEPGGDRQRLLLFTRTVLVEELRLIGPAGLVVGKPPDPRIKRGQQVAR